VSGDDAFWRRGFRMRRVSIAIALLLSVLVSAQADAATWGVRFTSLTSPIGPGYYATAAVATHAGASCSITVTYYSGPSHAAGLYPERASSSGRASWTWKVGTRTYAGSWPVTVSCTYGGSRHSATRYLRVT
jgi:hypothetical protein